MIYASETGYSFCVSANGRNRLLSPEIVFKNYSENSSAIEMTSNKLTLVVRFRLESRSLLAIDSDKLALTRAFMD